MNHLTRIATPLIAVAMMTVPMMAPAQSSQQGNGANNSTTSVPAAGVEQTKAYSDGVASAQADKAVGRAIDPQKSFRYVHPPVKKSETDAYRAAFTAGYQAQVKQASTASGQ